MAEPAPSTLVCDRGCTSYGLDGAVYACHLCGGLLHVEHGAQAYTRLSGSAWQRLFDSRANGRMGLHASGVWRYHEWVLPNVAAAHIISLGEGATPLTPLPPAALSPVADGRLGDDLGVEVLLKQCGHSLSGSFKDLGMTVLISQVHHMRLSGHRVPAVVCASTGDTSAALSAYAAAAQIPCVVLLPKDKISAAQLLQPRAQGAKVVAVRGDFDACMAHIQRLVLEQGVYLANSKNSLRLEGQKTLALEIAQNLGWQVPDWLVLPGGNLGNVAALHKGLQEAHRAGLISRLPRLLCAQAAQADPLYRSYQQDFAPLEPLEAGHTAATAIRIGNPVSFSRAVEALRSCNGVVASVDEAALAQAAHRADRCGLYTCPQTAVALAAVQQQVQRGVIVRGSRIVVVATAHGLKFNEFKQACCAPVRSSAAEVLEVEDTYEAVRAAALQKQSRG
jgi:threonine synthase